MVASRIAPLEALVLEVEKSIKTEKDLAVFSQMLIKVTIAAVLNVELDEYLGYEKSRVRNG